MSNDKVETIVKWRGEMKFVGENSAGNTVDMNPQQSDGIRPTQMALMAIGGCTGVDVVQMLKKMKQPLEGLSIKVDGVRRQEHPRTYETITIKYYFSGKLDERKVKRAVRLSQEKYCGVSNMFVPTAELKYEWEIETT
ncbi:OsmC family protein [Proteinivorax hydrogeniformans]|uniref:OsmC family protein n=1 Tax=Proteinivorax hydrogeniformans TaxID=1826727 RepID=A0AAU8HPS3_9FIRM